MEVCDKGERLFGKSLRNKQSHVVSDIQPHYQVRQYLALIFDACTMSPQFSEEDMIEEQIHFSNVVATFQQYAQYSVNRAHIELLNVYRLELHYSPQLTDNNRRRKDIYTLPLADRALLDSIGYRRKLQEIDNAILANANFLNKIVANPEIFGHDVDAGEYDGGYEAVTPQDTAAPLQQSAKTGEQGTLDS